MKISELKTTYHIEEDVAVVPGKAVIVNERTEDGTLVGRYTGYYDPEKCRFTLYPARTSLVVNLKPMVKHTVDAFFIRRDE